MKIIRRPKPSWVEIDHYPFLDEWVRGCRVWRTKEEPLLYRITTSPLQGERFVRWPAVVAIRNELLIRFQGYPVEFGWHHQGEKVEDWTAAEDMPPFRDKDTYLSNPDYVTMTFDWNIRRK
jgi:hypothetical protein